MSDYIRRRVRSTKEDVWVVLKTPAVYITKDGREFKEGELDMNFVYDRNENNPRRLPYWITHDVMMSIRDNIPPHIQITMLPLGDISPEKLGTYISPSEKNGELTISIYDWFGDRSSDRIINHSTAKGYTTFEDIIYYSLRDVFARINDRYPGDKYIIDTLKTAFEYDPSLEGKYSNFFKRLFENE